MVINLRSQWLRHLEQIRTVELTEVIRYLPPGQEILEIGAGSGWQSKILTDNGFKVSAIDIQASYYESQRIWPVTIYDGRDIPFANGSFDIVFSSNVLEHVAHIEAFQQEIQRVLKPNGHAIHLIPTPSWRFWTTLALYPHIVKKSAFKAREQLVKQKSTGLDATFRFFFYTIRLTIASFINRPLPQTHGVRGNVFSEFYYFSKLYWIKMFENNGWIIEKVSPNRLFYTGYGVFGSMIGASARQILSMFLGCACSIYILRSGKS
jgi:SAM-dependent methyltransferase